MADPVWTVRRVLEWTAADFEKRGIPSARLDADLLVARVLGMQRIALYLDLDRPLVPDELAGVRQLVSRRRAREPLAYILGEREFYGRPFHVDPAVLVPRPDTETLVERVLRTQLPQPALRVLDLCTGSGAIVISLLAERPDWSGTATDLSEQALDVARRNAERHGVQERLTLLRGDLFGALEPGARFDLIVANPPYVTEAEMEQLDPDVRDHEPRLALAAGADGLDVLRRLSAGAREHLQPGGRLLVEIGAQQGAAVKALFEQAGFEDVQVLPDLGERDRVLEGRA